MEPTRVLRRDDAASPVIGVVLIISITVLLAATAATFVIGIGEESLQETPQVAFGFDYESDDSSPAQDVLYITHQSGDAVDTQRLSAFVTDAATNRTGDHDERYEFASDLGMTSDQMVAGMQTNISVETHNRNKPPISALSLERATVRVVWESSDNGQSVVLARWDNGT